MSEVDNNMNRALDNRKQNGLLRKLRVSEDLIDFCSNDYLGFARDLDFKKNTEVRIKGLNINNINGATGSRLISGNYAFTEELEKKIAAFHGAEASLIYNSGYDANIGFFSCVPQRNDTILYDELVHASIRDGIRLSNAKSFSFKHNDLSDFKKKCKQSQGNTFVAVESVYSMDGDTAPISEFAEICEKYQANFIVDEAHATGVFGKKGKGLVDEFNLNDKVFARIITFGKALGCHGAAICGSNLLRDFLINFSRPFIYTTALPVHSILAIDSAYDYLRSKQKLLNTLQSNIEYFLRLSGQYAPDRFIPSRSAIHSIIIGGNQQTAKCALQLQNNEFDIRAILHPTVPKGTERLRICLHAFNTKSEIKNLFEILIPIINNGNE